MNSSNILVKLSLSIACLVLYNAVVLAQDAELVSHFDYDPKAQLSCRKNESRSRHPSLWL